jgi:hypothetical protein
MLKGLMFFVNLFRKLFRRKKTIKIPAEFGEINHVPSNALLNSTSDNLIVDEYNRVIGMRGFSRNLCSIEPLTVNGQVLSYDFVYNPSFETAELDINPSDYNSEDLISIYRNRGYHLTKYDIEKLKP